MSLSVLILTGQSGSGKSTALRALEDSGYFCVDNIPTSLVEPLVDLARAEPQVSQLALVMDVRGPHFADRAPALVEKLRQASVPLQVVFFEAMEDAIIRRYSETRRRHPLDDGSGLHQAIANERDILVPLRELADETLDTTSMSPHELRSRVSEQIAHSTPGTDLKIALVSFGFKFGLPLDADMVLDVRFLPNPYFDPDLSPLTGLDPEVEAYVLNSDEGRAFLQRAQDLVTFLLPRYQREGRRYLTVAVGCTGGKHRSVAITRGLARRLSEDGIVVDQRHRDVSGATT